MLHLKFLHIYMKTRIPLIHKNYFVALLSVILLFSSCKKKEKEEKHITDDTVETVTVTPVKIKVALHPKDEADATGNVVFKEEDGSVTMTAIISGLSSGEHPVYIQKQENDKNFIGNLIADDSGNGTISKISDEWCIGCSDAAKDILGKSVVIYTGTQISCTGVIK